MRVTAKACVSVCFLGALIDHCQHARRRAFSRHTALPCLAEKFLAAGRIVNDQIRPLGKY